MNINLAKSLRTILFVCFSMVANSLPTHACMFFDKADPIYWSKLATSIVDASVVSFEKKSLRTDRSNRSHNFHPETWVLRLRVHRTIRGDHSDFREVATRSLNTTIVDRNYLRELLNQRSEFAILDAPYQNPTEVTQSLQSFGYPPEIGVHVVDSKGDEIDEIWELICTALPIFELGTFPLNTQAEN